MISNNKSTSIVVKQAVSQEICALLSESIRLKAAVKTKKLKNDALAGVHREYGDPVMETLLQRLTPLIEQATGKSLWPTLSFNYLYQNGQKLLPHKDRSSCEYVAGLFIGADQAFIQQGKTWPLIVDGQAVNLDIGDLVIFKGYETSHWRECFTGSWYISAIFGYVNQNGPYAFQKYDQRKSLGQAHIGMFRWSLGCLKQNIRRLCHRCRN